MERPGFGVPGDRSRVYCKRHRVPGAVNLAAVGWKIPEGPRNADAGGWVEAEEDGMGVPVDSESEEDSEDDKAEAAKKVAAAKAAKAEAAAAKAKAKVAASAEAAAAAKLAEDKAAAETSAIAGASPPGMAGLVPGTCAPPAAEAASAVSNGGGSAGADGVRRSSSEVADVVGSGKEDRKKTRDDRGQGSKSASVAREELEDREGKAAKRQKTSGGVKDKSDGKIMERNANGKDSEEDQETVGAGDDGLVGAAAIAEEMDEEEEEEEDCADDPVFAPGRFVFLVPSKKCDRPILVGKIVRPCEMDAAPSDSHPPSSPPPPTIPVSSATALLLAKAAALIGGTAASPPAPPPAPIPAPMLVPAAPKAAFAAAPVDDDERRWIYVHWHTPASLRRTDYCR